MLIWGMFSVVLVCVTISGCLYLAGSVGRCHPLSDLEKMSPFECGFLPNMNSRLPFSAQFFLIAIIFLIFDIELVVLFPYLLSTQGGGQLAPLATVFFFLAALSLGLFMEWSQGTLEWQISKF